MRTIKFRSWREDEKRMRYGVDISEVVNTDNGECYNSQTKNLMQFTGLKDMHGKEIFEGDILKKTEGKSNKTSGVFEVVWRGAGFSISSVSHRYFGWLGEDVANYSEIIGTIYEK